MSGLGRRFQHDPGDREYPLRLAIAVQQPVVVPRLPLKVWRFRGVPLNQGEEGTCVGHGWEHMLVAAPIQKSDHAAWPDALDIYRGACLLDTFSDNDDGNPQAGTTVRGAAKWLQSQGVLRGDYRWAADADECADWLSGTNARGHAFGGGVVIGVNWWSGMDAPTPEGLIRATGHVRGGHCVLLNGVDNERGLFAGVNSWGPDWGASGFFWLPGEDLDRLIREDGEACAATEVKLPKAAQAPPAPPTTPPPDPDQPLPTPGERKAGDQRVDPSA